MKLVRSFPALDVTLDNNFRSLMYYYGMLSMHGVKGEMIKMAIPNQSVRMQYWHYVEQMYRRDYRFSDDKLADLFYEFAFEGDWEPLMRYLGDEFERVSTNRDAIGGEHNVQGFSKRSCREATIMRFVRR